LCVPGTRSTSRGSGCTRPPCGSRKLLSALTKWISALTKLMRALTKVIISQYLAHEAPLVVLGAQDPRAKPLRGHHCERTADAVSQTMEDESGPLRAVHLSRHKWPGGLVGHLLSSHTWHTKHQSWFWVHKTPVWKPPKSKLSSTRTASVQSVAAPRRARI